MLNCPVLFLFSCSSHCRRSSHFRSILRAHHCISPRGVLEIREARMKRWRVTLPSWVDQLEAQGLGSIHSHVHQNGALVPYEVEICFTGKGKLQLCVCVCVEWQTLLLTMTGVLPHSSSTSVGRQLFIASPFLSQRQARIQ